MSTDDRTVMDIPTEPDDVTLPVRNRLYSALGSAMAATETSKYPITPVAVLARYARVGKTKASSDKLAMLTEFVKDPTSCARMNFNETYARLAS